MSLDHEAIYKAYAGTVVMIDDVNINNYLKNTKK